jgi:hypothetical protein
MGISVQAQGLAALTANDAAANDYANCLDYTQPRLSGGRLSFHPLPAFSVAYLNSHKDEPDDDVTRSRGQRGVDVSCSAEFDT